MMFKKVLDSEANEPSMLVMKVAMMMGFILMCMNFELRKK